MIHINDIHVAALANVPYKVHLYVWFRISYDMLSIVRKGTNVSGVNPRRPIPHDELMEHNSR
jgi:hypothetical protein